MTGEGASRRIRRRFGWRTDDLSLNGLAILRGSPALHQLHHLHTPSFVNFGQSISLNCGDVRLHRELRAQ